MLRQFETTFEVATANSGAYEFTADVAGFVRQCAIHTGLVNLLVQHTSASLTIQENADPDVHKDLLDALARLAPEDGQLYRHNAEGPDDMPAHIKSALTSTTLAIPVLDGALRLGTWQGIYLLEHRYGAHFGQRGHIRRIACHLLGE